MELSKFRLWVFCFSVLSIFKKLPLTIKSIQDNLSLKSKRFSHASMKYAVFHHIDSLKVDCKFLNKRKPIHPYRENPLKKPASIEGNF